MLALTRSARLPASPKHLGPLSRRAFAQSHARRMPVDPAAFVQQGKKVRLPSEPCVAWRGRGGQAEEYVDAERTSQIVAIGRNYAEHIKELSNDAPKEPMFFLKPTTSYIPSGGNVEIPRGVTAHHEGACSRVYSGACGDSHAM